ncbi:hypothetical protein M413DRAFT_10483 [Hebeloma cylindrosporum]|uniref:F-box domain-containing protein n=1 Tax=Hebeloma cylindrosporum TaxID=76867 RepID=A0A0C2YMR4_HEBCY|nr:hypothetical protein M413DRAFT_10483 [Hebeloma cylindrosporum h7]
MNHTTLGFKDFQSLPYDIHSLILSFLSPEDIIAIRKTCKIIFDATLQRDLWMKAVTRMCEENTALPSSFPIPDMSLLELEYASLGVTRWKKLVIDAQNEGQGSLSAVRDISLGNDDIQSAQPYLVPGGRFLLTLTPGRFSIWDLYNIHEASGADRQPIAGFDSECGSFTAHPTPDGSGIIIITVTYHNFTVEDVDIREYYLDFTSVVGNCLVLLYGPLVKIWNFILMDERTIALIREREVRVWDFPQLSASRDAQEEFKKTPESGLSNVVPPRFVVGFPDDYSQDPDYGLGCGGLCDWYTGSRQPLMFDMWEASAGAEYFEFTRFHLDTQHPQGRLQITSESPAQLTLQSSDSRPSCAAYRACGDDAVVAWSDNESIHCHTGGLSSHSRTNSINTLLDIKNVASREFSLCPISGRLCYVNPDTHDVRVVDFFPLPPSKA